MITNVPLSDPEVKLLHELLQEDLRRLLLEIARTDCRSMKDGLRAQEVLLQGVIQKLETKD